MTRCRVASIVLCIVSGFTVCSQAANPLAPKSWPNWMGPNHDGVSAEAGWKSTWPEEGLPVAWSRQIGIGFSSISIADGRLFTMGHVDGEEIIWCLDAKTGDEIWTHRYACDLNNNLH